MRGEQSAYRPYGRALFRVACRRSASIGERPGLLCSRLLSRCARWLRTFLANRLGLAIQIGRQVIFHVSLGNSRPWRWNGFYRRFLDRGLRREAANVFF
jgi:hypothetical protein